VESRTKLRYAFPVFNFPAPIVILTFIIILQSSAGKHVKPAAPVDFAAYKSKLKFTAGTVDELEVFYFILFYFVSDKRSTNAYVNLFVLVFFQKIYKSTKLPEYTASLSSLESHRRAALVCTIVFVYLR
jgi:hypothetical protein